MNVLNNLAFINSMVWTPWYSICFGTLKTLWRKNSSSSRVGTHPMTDEYNFNVILWVLTVSRVLSVGKSVLRCADPVIQKIYTRQRGKTRQKWVWDRRTQPKERWVSIFILADGSFLTCSCILLQCCGLWSLTHFAFAKTATQNRTLLPPRMRGTKAIKMLSRLMDNWVYHLLGEEGMARVQDKAQKGRKI